MRNLLFHDRRRIVLIALPLAAAFFALGVQGCGSSTPGPTVSTDSATEIFERAKGHYAKRDWDKAKMAFESLIYSYPGAVMVDSAQFLLAMSAYEVDDYIVAADEFRRLHARYPNSPMIEEGDLLRCRSLLKIAPKNAALDQEKTVAAITELKLFKDSYPLSSRVASADSLLREANGRLSRRDYRAAVLYDRLGRYQAARIYFQQVIDNHTESPFVPDCLFHIAEGFRKQDSADRALEYYEKLVYLYPDAERVNKAKKRIADLGRLRDTAGVEP